MHTRKKRCLTSFFKTGFIDEGGNEKRELCIPFIFGFLYIYIKILLLLARYEAKGEI